MNLFSVSGKRSAPEAGSREPWKTVKLAAEEDDDDNDEDDDDSVGSDDEETKKNLPGRILYETP